MARILVLFGTNYGQTRKIARRIAEAIRQRDHQVEMLQGNKISDSFSPDGFEAAIIGTSIYMGQHQISVRKLVKQHKGSFNRIPTAYYCVCLTATSNESKDQKQVAQFIQDFLSYTGLQPVHTGAFAGALRYPHYNFFRRYMAKLVARKVGADTNTKKELHEYTDWVAVDKFASDFLNKLDCGL